MRRAVVLVLDGLRRDMLTEALTPNLAAHARQSETFAAHRSVFPSATRVVSSSFATGCYPAKHELQGNSLVLIEEGRLVAHDAGHPDFLQHKRRVTGRSLAVPTLAERLKAQGGAIILSNVSPGAAYAHDPDGHGFVYHRAGSFGPGRRKLEKPDAVDVTLDAAGDRALAERFVTDVLFERRPALALLWLAEPDASSHAHPLGISSPSRGVEADGSHRPVCHGCGSEAALSGRQRAVHRLLRSWPPDRARGYRHRGRVSRCWREGKRRLRRHRFGVQRHVRARFMCTKVRLPRLPCSANS